MPARTKLAPIPNLRMDSAWSDRSATEAKAKSFIAEFAVWHEQRVELYFKSYQLARKKGAVKACAFMEAEFKRLFPDAVIGHLALNKGNKEMLMHVTYASTASRDQMELNYVRFIKRKTDLALHHESGVLINRHFIASCLRRLRITSINDLSLLLKCFLQAFITLQLSDMLKKDGDRFVMLKKGLGYLVCQIDSGARSTVTLITIITENLYTPYQKATVDGFYSQENTESILLIANEDLRHDDSREKVINIYVLDDDILKNKSVPLLRATC